MTISRRRVMAALPMLGGGVLGSGLFARRAMAHGLDVRLAPQSFAPLVRAVAPSIVGISVIQYAGPAPAAPRLDMPNQRTPAVRSVGPRAAPRAVQAAGSGFVVTKAGIIVTNNHVVGNAREIVVTLDSGRQVSARVVGTDQLTDLAIVKIDVGADLPTVTWGDSAHMQVGDWILAAGNPFDLGTSFTAGIISARGRQIDDDPFDRFFQLDAPINPGNSGGPSFDMRGHVIGVNTAIVSPSGGSVGIGFAIPSNLARRVIAALIAHGSIARGWLGISATDRAGALPGAVITGVDPQGPAGGLGLAPGDVILAVNHHKVGDANDLTRMIAASMPGRREILEVERRGRLYALPVTIGRRPAELRSE
ncbi:serine protease Do [Acidiphilium sp. MT5]